MVKWTRGGISKTYLLTYLSNITCFVHINIGFLHLPPYTPGGIRGKGHLLLYSVSKEGRGENSYGDIDFDVCSGLHSGERDDQPKS